jgi:iron(III) transport system substrate-binding protein
MRITALVVGLLLLAGCSSRDELVVYTSVDQPYAEPILRAFTQRTGIAVRAVYDSEASKSVGLAERVLAEKDAPKCDVWWGNEPFHTIRLANAGVLASHAFAGAGDVPATFRDAEGRWVGVALRARVIATAAGATASFPSIQSLADPAHRGKITMARPTAGTTGGHVAALYVLWGNEKADAFFRSLHANGITLLGGNSVVTQHVGNGTYVAGLTDNDDVDAAKKAGGSLEMVVPDQQPDGIGTLAIPTTVALVANRPGSRDPAQQLADFLVSAEAEQMLLDSGFARFSVRASEGERAIRVMAVDFPAVADQLSDAVRRATAILEGR